MIIPRSKKYRKSTYFFLFLLLISLAVPPVLSITVPNLTQQEPSQLSQQGKTLYEQRNYEKAATLWQQAAAAYAAQADSLNQGMALSNLSLTYQQLGQWEQAKLTLNQSINLLNSLEDTPEKQRIFAQTLDIQGRLQRAIGESELAAATWQAAADLYTRMGDRNASRQSSINQSQAWQDLGLYPRACKTLLSALDLGVEDCKSLTDLPRDRFNQKLEILKNQPDSLLKFDGLQSLGNILRIVGDLQLSQTLLESSLAVATALQSPQEQSTALLSLGNTARALVDKQTLLPSPDRNLTILVLKTQEALKFYQEAAQLSPTLTGKVLAESNQLSLLLESQQWLGEESLTNAQNLWLSLQMKLPLLPTTQMAIYAQINLALNLIKFKQQQGQLPSHFPTANTLQTILIKATEQAKILGDKKAEAYAVGSQGFLSEQMQQWEQAERLTQQALNLAPTYTMPDIAYQYFWQLGRIRKTQADIEKRLGNLPKSEADLESATAAYTTAFETLQSLRSDLVAINPEVQFSFRDSVEPVYRELVSLSLQVAQSFRTQGRIDDSQKMLKQARRVIESLQLAELNNFFQDACVTVKTQQIDEIDRTAAIIYPIILKEQLEVIVSLPGGRLFLFTPDDPNTNSPVVTPTELENTLKELRVGEKNASIQSTASGNNFLPLSQRVYHWLIQPAETVLQESQAKTLVFVLDGELRNLPMAVLHDGNQYLVEKYAIALTPGLQLLSPQSLSTTEFRALIAGATNAPSFQKNNLNPLPAVEKELEQIAIKFPRNEKRENQEFTKANLQALINQVPFPVVHLATHGQFSSNAEKTFILDWNGQINVRDFDQILRTADPKKPIELLVLSACETMEGDSRAALGLAGVAVRAGARSTVATLWQVSDASTAIFMSEFYSQLAQTQGKINKAEALRRAQLKLLKESQYQHPFFWAPYVLVGNWQ